MNPLEKKLMREMDKIEIMFLLEKGYELSFGYYVNSTGTHKWVTKDFLYLEEEWIYEHNN